MREGFGFEDLTLPPPAQVVSVIQSSGHTHTCVVQVQAPKEMLGMFRQFDLDLIWDTPMGFTGDSLVVSVVGEDEELRKLMGVIDTIGEVREMHVQPASFHREDILGDLTDRQREVLVAAKRVVEHLRKAEGRLMESLLAGY